MSTDQRPTVGREATPTPSNAGQSSLGTILRLETDPVIRGTRWVHCLGTPRLRRSLEEAGLAVWPAAPGLATEALDLVPVQAVVVEEAALENGPWAGARGDAAPDLARQIVGMIERAAQLETPVYWLSAASTDREAQDDQPAVRQVDLASVFLIAPGTPLFEGDPEGAPSTRLLRCLRQHVVDTGHRASRSSGACGQDDNPAAYDVHP